MASQILSRLFPKPGKKAKPAKMMSLTAIEWGALSLESIKKELKKPTCTGLDAALYEAVEVRSSLRSWSPRW
jgi:hypothetical protein